MFPLSTESLVVPPAPLVIAGLFAFIIFNLFSRSSNLKSVMRLACTTESEIIRTTAEKDFQVDPV